MNKRSFLNRVGLAGLGTIFISSKAASKEQNYNRRCSDIPDFREEIETATGKVVTHIFSPRQMADKKTYSQTKMIVTKINGEYNYENFHRSIKMNPITKKYDIYSSWIDFFEELP